MDQATSETSNRDTSVLNPGVRTTATVVCYYFAFIGLGLLAAAFGPTLQQLAKNTHTGLSVIGFLFTARSLGYLLGSYLGGRLTDRLKGHRVLVVSMMVMSVMVALIPIINLLWILILVMFTLGLAESNLDIGGNTLLLWMFGAKAGPFMNGLHFFFGVGAFLSPIIVAQVILVSGEITWVYWLLALVILSVVPWLIRLPSPQNPGAHKDDIQAKPLVLPVILIALLFATHVGAEAAFGDWIYTYVVIQNMVIATTAAYLNAAFWGSFTLGRLLGVVLSMRFKPHILILVDLVASLVSAAIFLIWPTSIQACWFGVIGMGLSMASIFPMLLAYASRMMRLTGKINAWFFVGASGGSMILPWAFGRLLDVSGPRSMMLALLLDLLLALVIFICLFFYDRIKGNRAFSQPA